MSSVIWSLMEIKNVNVDPRAARKRSVLLAHIASKALPLESSAQLERTAPRQELGKTLNVHSALKANTVHIAG